jgi:hypothetical protein
MKKPFSLLRRTTVQGRFVSFDCAFLVIMNKCNHVAWNSDI